jgi:hypothetical protein
LIKVYEVVSINILFGYISAKPKSGRARMRGFLKALIIFLISFFGLLLLIFIFLNLPSSHRFVTKKVNQILSSSGIPVHINSVIRILPGTLFLEGILINGPEKDTIVYAKSVRSEFSTLALLKNRILLPSLKLENVKVTFSRDDPEKGLNIEEAFSANKSPVPEKQNKKDKTWDISIGKAEINRLAFRMTDSVSGIYIDQDVKKILIETEKMSLVDKTIRVKVLEIDGETGRVVINNKTDNNQTESVGGDSWNVELQELIANGINLVYDDQSQRFKLDLVAAAIKINTNNIDLKKKVIDFNLISLSGTNLLLSTDKTAETEGKIATVNPGTFDWDIGGGVIDLQHLSFRTAGYNRSADSTYLPAISILEMSMNLSDLHVNKENVNADIKSLNFELGNGFSLQKLKGNVNSGQGNTAINISLETKYSHLNLECKSKGGFFDLISDPYEIKNAEAIIKNTGISLNDLTFFKPDLIKLPVFKALTPKLFNITADISSDDSDLTITDLSISQENSFVINFKGKVANSTVTENLNGVLQFDIHDINQDWLKGLAGDIGIRKDFPDFKNLSLNGTISDSVNSPDFDISLKSDLGNIGLVGSFNFRNKSYSAESVFDNLLLDKITGSQSLGSFNGSANITGTGLTLSSMQADMLLLVDSIYFNKYEYKNTSIKVKLGNEHIDLSLVADDPFIKLNLNSSVSFKDSDIGAMADGTFSADLNKLHLAEDTLSLEGKISGLFKRKKNNTSAQVTVSGLLLSTPRDFARLDQINFTFYADSTRSSLTGKGDFFNTSFNIEKPVSELNTMISGFRNYLKAFLDPDQSVSAKRSSFLPQIKAELHVSYNKILGMAIRDTSLHFSDLNLSLVKNTGNNRIDCRIDGSGLSYKVAEIGNLNSIITDSSGILDMTLEANNFRLLTRLTKKVKLTARLGKGAAVSRVTFFGNADDLLYDIALGASSDTAGIKVEVPSGELILNGVKWLMDTPDLLSYSRPNKTISPSLKMHTVNSFINVLTNDSAGIHTYKAVVRNVTLTSLISSDFIKGFPEGSVSGFVEYGVKKKSGIKIATDLQLADVRWNDLRYDKISLTGKFDSNGPEDYAVELIGKLDSAEISVKGGKPVNGKRNVLAEFKLIPVNTFQPFAEKYLSDLKGYVSGKIDFQSENGKETFTGAVSIKNGNLRIKPLNSIYKIPAETIKFEGQKAIFDNFTILDSLKHELNVDGNIDYSNIKSITADLGINSSNMQIMNKNEDKNSSFYGDIFIDSKLTVKGPVTNPVLKGKITLTSGTEIFFRQMENLSLSESGKILTFESRNPAKGKESKKILPAKTVYSKTSIESVVVIDPSTKLNIGLSNRMYKIDLAIQGGGELNYNMLSNSQVSLTGKYEVSEGSANLKMIGWPNKAFTITKGGFIHWSGKLDDPELMFEAVNKVKSSYVNPVDNKERPVDFDVKLKISNNLSDMAVLFSISTPDQYLMSIVNTLSPEEQMRQAITILLFKQIDLPGISTSSNYMTEQVNQIVATQLNQLTKTTIKGVDISFGIDSYVKATETGGQETKTSLSYQLKRSLLNNRAQIELSGRLNDVNRQPNSSDLSLNNFTFEYRLDSAATRFLKVYNEHTYEDVFEGEVIKTGIGFTYRKSYRSLGDIWRKNEKAQKEQKDTK